MKPTLSVLVGVFCAVTTVVNAFAPPCSTATTATIETNSGYRQPPGGSSLFMADTTSTTSDDKIAALRAEAAKAKEAAEKLRKVGFCQIYVTSALETNITTTIFSLYTFLVPT